MITKGTREITKEYYENSALNQSLLKQLIKGPQAFIAATQEPEQKLYYEEKGHFIIGGAVDCNLTMVDGIFEETYHFPEENTKKPSDKVMSIINMAFDLFKGTYYDILVESIMEEDSITKEEVDVNRIVEIMNNSNSWNTLLYESANSHEYFMNRKKPIWQEDNRLNTIKEGNYSTYLISLINAIGKQIVDTEEAAIINGIIMSLTTHPNTAKYFTNTTPEGIDRIYQMPIYFTYMDEDRKCLLDLVEINHNDKTIQPLDIKTTSYEPYNFLYALKDRKYDIQAADYSNGLETIKESLGYSDYTVLPFKFLVETTNPAMIGNPLVFTCGKSILEIGMNGKPDMSNFLSCQHPNPIGNEIVYKGDKGINQLIEDYKWYKEHGFNRRKEVQECGEFTMEWHKIFPNNKN